LQINIIKQKNMALDYQTAYQAFVVIQNSQLADMRKSLYKAAVNYASKRTEWYFLTQEERVEQDGSRSIIHNRFIDSCNQFSRQQSAIAEDNRWRALLGNDRKIIGDWACFLCCFIAIGNR